MKKRNLKSLQLNKKSISNLEIFIAKGGSGRTCNADSNIICDEGKTNTNCLFNSDCIC